MCKRYSTRWCEHVWVDNVCTVCGIERELAIMDREDFLDELRRDEDRESEQDDDEY